MRLGPCLILLLATGLGGCAAASEGHGAALSPASGPSKTAPSAADEQGEPDAPMSSLARAAAREPTGNAWADCYRTFQPSDDPGVDLVRLAAACAARAGMVAVTPVHRGSQGEDDPPERLGLRVHKGRCYRAFAVGAPSVIDLDIAAFDPTGALVAGDISRDRWPVVPPLGPLCAPKSGRYTLEIGVARGRGAYLFQLWGSRDDDEDDEDAAASAE